MITLLSAARQVNFFQHRVDRFQRPHAEVRDVQQILWRTVEEILNRENALLFQAIDGADG